MHAVMSAPRPYLPLLREVADSSAGGRAKTPVNNFSGTPLQETAGEASRGGEHIVFS